MAMMLTWAHIPGDEVGQPHPQPLIAHSKVSEDEPVELARLGGRAR
jgi:hypothetical protein